MTTYHVLFNKLTERSVNSGKIDKQLALMSAAVCGWPNFKVLSSACTLTEISGKNEFSASFKLEYNGVGVPESVIPSIIHAMQAAGKVYGWNYVKYFQDAGSDSSVDEPVLIVGDFPREAAAPEPEVDLGEYSPYFGHLYGLSSQISIALSALEAANSTHFMHRFHSVFVGPPGSGKTESLLGFEKVMGGGNVIKFDGPSCSKAGLENFFLDNPEESAVPRVMLFEEIEKTEPEALKMLLGILDTRGEVRKTTGDQGQRTCAVKVLCLATVNNESLFEKLHAGALSSRFTHKINFPRPSRATLERILEREISKVKGKDSWIKPALDYVIDVEKCYDPRRAIAVCLSGRNNLLTGAYQKALRSIHSQKTFL